MRVGLALPQLGPHVDARAVRGFAERAETLGFGHLFVQQHLFYPHHVVSGYSARPGLAVPEAYRSVVQPLELLAAVAAWTSQVVVGTSILVAGYHRPLDLAQRISTLDLLSGGRTVFGFSVGWSDEEHAQYDVDPRTRGRRVDELIDALKACWGPDPVSYSGQFFDIPVSDVRPKPVQQPDISGLIRR
jgi:alkanesulfonate monooxygenase SsuD/methylene tetrahydromethanopterin reductase-like flavin-dependent oxidoreductase (luciferase family)